MAGPDTAVRVARESYGPLNPVVRTAEEGVEAWSRYDTPGQTIYACADPVTAYMELLAPYRTDVNRERRALQPIADAMRMDLDALWDQIVAEWDEAGTMKASWLPRAFRDGRKLYTLRFPDGLVDRHHGDRHDRRPRRSPCPPVAHDRGPIGYPSDACAPHR